MRLRNTSPYHTATLRKILNVTFRAATSDKWSQWWATVHVSAVVGRKYAAANFDYSKAPKGVLTLRLPKLTGDELLPLLRQQHGGAESKTFKALGSLDVAAQVRSALFDWLPNNERLERLSDSELRARLDRAKVPIWVPLRVIKPPKEKAPRDIVTTRYERVLELEAKWTRKLKLAQTKLKKLRQRKRHYEKKINQRKQNDDTT